MKTTRSTESHERVFLVGVGLKRASHVPGIVAGDAERASLEELAELARAAGAQVAGSIFQMRDKVDPATMIGRGKIDELKIEADLHHAPLIIFDRNLSPTQLRNLEKGTECRVIDRTQPRRPIAGGTRATELFLAASCRKLKRTFAASGRYWIARPRRTKTGNRSPAYPRSHQ
jgi:GTP-binding protein HflX